MWKDYMVWERNHENILRDWKVKCFIQAWMQTASGYYFKHIYDLLSFPVVILSSVSGATLFITQNTTAKYVVGSISLLSGVMTAVLRQMRPDELFQQHIQTSKRYQTLIRRIDVCLSLPKGMRQDAYIFIDRVGNEIETLSKVQLYAPRYIIKKFEAKFGQLDQILYGEDIIELLKKDLYNQRQVKKIYLQSS